MTMTGAEAIFLETVRDPDGRPWSLQAPAAS